jgi:hypothetical protein
MQRCLLASGGQHLKTETLGVAMNNTRGRRLLRLGVALVVFALVLAAVILSGTLSASAGERQSLSMFQGTPVVGLSAQSYSIPEGNTATISVFISQAPATTVTVEYLTVPGTAIANVDYVPANGILTFPPSVNTPRTFQVQTLHNTSSAEDRQVNLVLRNPINALLSANNSTAVLIIQDIDPTPTATSGATGTPIYTDQYEPNNTLNTAYPTAAGANALCNATLWPVGDLDYYSFVGKAGKAYEVLTSNLSPGLDTVLTVFNTNGNVIGSNDDYTFGSSASRVVFSASTDGFYYARVVNNSPQDPANKTYCFEINEIQGTATPTPLPTGTRVPGPDICEYNGDFNSACLYGAGDTFNMNFVPIWGEGPDNDFYRMWVKPGILYTCETFDLSSVNDTNMILYDQNQNGIGGNDDKAPGDFGSKVSYQSTYTGWLFILVGPHAPPEYALSYLYTYSLRCTDELAPTPTPTSPPFTGVVPRPPTPTPIPSPSPTPEGTTVAGVPTVPPTPTPNVQVAPLPTSPPTGGTEQTLNVELTVYFDANMNFTPEQTEGVQDVAVSVYDNATNELLAFGYTNETGVIRFGSLVVSGALRISIPFLQYNQIVASDSNIFIRIAPLTPIINTP